VRFDAGTQRAAGKWALTTLGDQGLTRARKRRRGGEKPVWRRKRPRPWVGAALPFAGGRNPFSPTRCFFPADYGKGPAKEMAARQSFCTAADGSLKPRRSSSQTAQGNAPKGSGFTWQLEGCYGAGGNNAGLRRAGRRVWEALCRSVPRVGRFWEGGGGWGGKPLDTGYGSSSAGLDGGGRYVAPFGLATNPAS